MIIKSVGRLHKTNVIKNLSTGIHGYSYHFFFFGFQKNGAVAPSLFRTLNL